MMSKIDNMRSNLVIHLTTKNLLIVIFSLQLAFLGLVGLEKLGLEIPILRQAVGFIYLTFVPGFLIFKILQINNRNIIESLLYSVGLSLSFLMFTGALINFLYPLIGISKPISEISLIITISVIVLLLCFICYLRDKGYSTTFSINKKQLFSPFVLSLSLLPFLAVFGTYLLNFYDNNILLLILLAIISAIPIFVESNRISERIYPFAVWSISISLLFYNSLISMYIRGGDVELAHHLSNSVITNGLWDSTIPSNMNAMLSIVMLPPIFVDVCNIDFIWFVKIIYALLLSFLPVGLYQLYKKQTNEKIAFFSCFFFVSMYLFFVWLSMSIKQGFAEFFLSLLVLLMIDKDMSNTKQLLLSIVFMFSLIVSHYAISYIFMFSVIFALCFILLDKKFMKRYNDESIISPTFVSLYIVFAIGWYMYISSSWTFNTIVGLGNNIVSSIAEFLNPEYSFTAHILGTKWTLSIQIMKYLYLIASFFIAIGILVLLLDRHFYKENKFKFHYDYAVLSISFFVMLLGTFVPATTIAISTDRVYQITSVLLAPFCVIGSIEFCKSFEKVYSKLFHITDKHSLKVISIFLMIFLLFNSGWASEVIIKDSFLPDIYISKERIIRDGDPAGKLYLYDKYTFDCDVFSAQWLLKNMESDTIIYTDKDHGVSSFPYIAEVQTGITPYTRILSNTHIKQLKGYIYLRHLNIKEGIIEISVYPTIKWDYTSKLYPILNASNKIYTNGGSEIYHR